MIREIINFTKNLIEDTPDVLGWKVVPDNGLHVFIDLSPNCVWLNKSLEKSKDYEYFDGKNKNLPLWNDCIRYQNASTYITMNKVKRFDPKQKIHSCSPFSVAYNFNFNKTDLESMHLTKAKGASKEEVAEIDRKIRIERYRVVKERLSDYKKNALNIYNLDIDNFEQMNIIDSFYSQFDSIMQVVKDIPEYSLLTAKDYVHIYLRSIPIEFQELKYQEYLKDNLLNGDEIAGKGIVSFFTSYSDKKLFLQHRTGLQSKGYGQRFSKDDALLLQTFDKILKRKCFPNPLPIVIDDREINNQIVRIFNGSEDPLPYRELLKQLMDKSKINELKNYYLFYYTNTKNGMVINDLDFVPLFEYLFKDPLVIHNLLQISEQPDIKINNVFDFERIVVKTIFNNSFVKITKDSYSTNYFGEIKPEYVIGGDTCYQMILKYRKAFYEYIYKSKRNAVDTLMFDDIMYNSIVSIIRTKDKDIYSDTDIRTKLNIWFSLYNCFNNNSNNNIMITSVTDLQSKIAQIARGEASLETPEEFAFGAGQLASYLMGQSVAKDNTYAMLEPYLQKSKVALLQDALAQGITTYKHEIWRTNSNFNNLSAHVLGYGNNVDMKPLLRYFLAGCFSKCVMFEKKNNN